VPTEVANFWFAKTTNFIPNHLTNEPLDSVLTPEEIQQEASPVKKLTPYQLKPSSVATSSAQAGKTTKPQAKFAGWH